jgi:tRNA A-37 threonylcarbamoyl transferase component Bud32
VEQGENLKSLQQRFGPFILFTSPDLPFTQEVMQAMLPEPEAVFLQGDTLPLPRLSAKADKRRIHIAGCDYFAKRYNCTSCLYQVKNILRPSRALLSWRAAQEFMRRQVPTPLPLLCMEERHYGLLGRSYIVFPFLDDSIDLLNLWPQLDPGERERCLSGLAAAIGHMHSRGVYHGDTNWRNILVRRQGEAWSFFFIDLDGCVFLKRPQQDRALRDLQHFIRDLERHQVSPQLQDLFVERWEKAIFVHVR